MKFDRAYRRAQRDRLKQKRKNYWGYPYQYPDHFEKMSVDNLGKIVDTPHPCSKYCCGNPRKHFGHRTLQEVKFSCEPLED